MDEHGLVGQYDSSRFDAPLDWIVTPPSGIEAGAPLDRVLLGRLRALSVRFSKQRIYSRDSQARNKVVIDRLSWDMCLVWLAPSG